MKGWEVIKTISEENINRGIILYFENEKLHCIDIKNKELCWKPGEFNTSLLTSNIEFHIIRAKQLEQLNKAYNTLLKVCTEIMEEAADICKNIYKNIS